MLQRCYLVANPTSGGFSPERIHKVMEKLRGGGLAPELLMTGSAEDAPRFARRICQEESSPLILVAGGDGTMNGVLNGVAPGCATLGFLPLGTSNVLARELKIRDLDDAVGRVIKGKSRPVAVGEIESCRQKRRFLLMIGAGFDGAVVGGVRLSEKRVLGKLAYVLSALRHLVRWDLEDLHLVADGKTFSCHSVIICNAGRYGGNFLLAPKAELFAPGFQVLCIRGGRLAYLKLALRLVLGKASTSRCVTLLDVQELELTGEKAVQLDGDPCGRLPLKLRALPDFVRLVV